MIPPADMLLFAAVVREASFTRAARQLGITKQTASERIGKLEERLGVRLLERSTRRLRVTDVGAAYYERCRAIAAQIDEANREVLKERDEPVGLLRVTAPALYCRRFLAPVVVDYLARHPRARVELVPADRRVNLIEDGFDLAIRIGNLGDSSLTVRKLGVGHVYYVASPGFLAMHGIPTAKTLRTVRCIGRSPFETWKVSGVPSKIEPVLVVKEFDVAYEAALAGIGVAQLPGIVCWQAVQDGRLRVLFGPEPAMLRPIYAVYPSRRHLAAKVRVFLDVLTRLMEPMLPLDVPADESTPRPAQRRGASRR
jgi:DNA-binding transcriptional LysR family regulator